MKRFWRLVKLVWSACASGHMFVWVCKGFFNPVLLLLNAVIHNSPACLRKEKVLEENLPVPKQYLHRLCSCCLTLFISTTIRAEITPTAPPEKDATMGST